MAQRAEHLGTGEVRIYYCPYHQRTTRSRSLVRPSKDGDPMASSRPIAAGEDYTPDDINNLRNDVLDPVGGHKHNGTDGAKVPFSNLDVAGASGSTPPTGGSKSYNDIANHVASSQNVHGLGSLGHVLGATVAGLGDPGGHESQWGAGARVTFPHAFAVNADRVCHDGNAPGSEPGLAGRVPQWLPQRFCYRIRYQAVAAMRIKQLSAPLGWR